MVSSVDDHRLVHFRHILFSVNGLLFTKRFYSLIHDFLACQGTWSRVPSFHVVLWLFIIPLKTYYVDAVFVTFINYSKQCNGVFIIQYSYICNSDIMNDLRYICMNLILVMISSLITSRISIIVSFSNSDRSIV